MSNYHVRLAHQTELAQLPLIERAASVRFLTTPYADLASDEASIDEAYLRQQHAHGLVWVAADATDEPIGFVVAELLDSAIYIHELDVLPAHGQRGVGRRLVTTVCEWARTSGYPAVTLSTFRNVPWNAPFYARLGFGEMSEVEMSAGLRAIRAAEAQGGLPINSRVMMRLPLQAI